MLGGGIRPFLVDLELLEGVSVALREVACPFPLIGVTRSRSRFALLRPDCELDADRDADAI